MKQYKVALLDWEEEYVLRFMEYVNSKKDIPFMILAFTCGDKLKAYLQQGKVDLILEGKHKAPSLDQSFCSIPLTEESIGGNTIYKYQPIQGLIKDVMGRLNHQGITFEKENNVKAYGVYSPIGRSGKTRLALGICRYIGNGLYLGMEEYSGFSYEKYGMDDLMFYIKERNKASLLGKIKGMTQRAEGVEIIESPLYYLDMRTLKYQDMKWLLVMLKTSGLYSVIVADIGGGSVGDFNLLNGFDTIYVPILEGQVAQQKKNHMEHFFQKMEQKEILEKIQYLQVPEEPFFSIAMEQWLAALFHKEQ